MSEAMSTITVDVDVTNPGQFFACCGLLELAHRLWPGAEGWFDNGSFHLTRPDRQTVVFQEMLRLVIECSVEALPADDSKTAPIRLGPPIGMVLSWWLRPDGSTNLFKTWAANATSQQMFTKWRQPLQRNLTLLDEHPEQVLTVTERVQGSYGFDSDLGWDALRVGFSLNEHAGLKELPTRPAVEILGAVGLQRFFPVFKEKEQVVEYATWRVPLAAPVASVAAIGLVPPATLDHLRTRFVYRGSFKGLDSATLV